MSTKLENVPAAPLPRETPRPATSNPDDVSPRVTQRHLAAAPVVNEFRDDRGCVAGLIDFPPLWASSPDRPLGVPWALAYAACPKTDSRARSGSALLSDNVTTCESHHSQNANVLADQLNRPRCSANGHVFVDRARRLSRMPSHVPVPQCSSIQRRLPSQGRCSNGKLVKVTWPFAAKRAPYAADATSVWRSYVVGQRSVAFRISVRQA